MSILKIGNKVRVSNDLKRTYYEFGKHHLMEEMKGKTYKIMNFSFKGAVKLNYNQFISFHFNKNDLILVEKSELFDPIKLVI